MSPGEPIKMVRVRVIRPPAPPPSVVLTAILLASCAQKARRGGGLGAATACQLEAGSMWQHEQQAASSRTRRVIDCLPHEACHWPGLPAHDAHLHAGLVEALCGAEVETIPAKPCGREHGARRGGLLRPQACQRPVACSRVAATPCSIPPPGPQAAPGHGRAGQGGLTQDEGAQRCVGGVAPHHLNQGAVCGVTPLARPQQPRPKQRRSPPQQVHHACRQRGGHAPSGRGMACAACAGPAASAALPCQAAQNTGVRAPPHH